MHAGCHAAGTPVTVFLRWLVRFFYQRTPWLGVVYTSSCDTRSKGKAFWSRGRTQPRFHAYIAQGRHGTSSQASCLYTDSFLSQSTSLWITWRSCFEPAGRLIQRTERLTRVYRWQRVLSFLRVWRGPAVHWSSLRFALAFGELFVAFQCE